MEWMVKILSVRRPALLIKEQGVGLRGASGLATGPVRESHLSVLVVLGVRGAAARTGGWQERMPLSGQECSDTAVCLDDG